MRAAPTIKPIRNPHEALVGAMERLMAERPPAEIGVAEVSRLAGISVAGFFTQFDHIDSLVEAVRERASRKRIERLQEVLNPEAVKGLDLRDRCRRFASAMVEDLWALRGLVDSAHADHPFFGARDLLLECQNEIAHPIPERAAEAALALAVASARDAILGANPAGFTADEIGRLLAHQMYAFLTTAP